MSVRRKVREGVAGKIKDYINNSPKYKLLTFIEENVTKDIDMSNYNPKIKCPFHGKDNTPSCNIRMDINGFKCFGCDAGGDYIEFVRLFHKVKEGTDIGYYTVMERLLQSDPRMKLEVGLSSIYQYTELSLEDAVDAPMLKFVPREKRTLNSLLELKRWMTKSGHLTKESIQIAIISAQQELGPEEIKSIILGEVRNDIIIPDMSTVDLDSILGQFEVEME